MAVIGHSLPTSPTRTPPPPQALVEAKTQTEVLQGAQLMLT